MPGEWDARRKMAELSDLLPAEAFPAPRPRLLRWLPRRKRAAKGLAAIPERYRLQFLLLAAERLSGRPAAEVAGLADELADRTRIPAGLLRQLPETTELDAWFREQVPVLREHLEALTAAA